jgi:hypothetical protein
MCPSKYLNIISEFKSLYGVCSTYSLCYSFIHVTQALRLVRQEPLPSNATDMALVCCFLGKVLVVGCHYFPPPSDIPTFLARYHHVCTTREIVVAKGGTIE